jgi:hypothetical protein
MTIGLFAEFILSFAEGLRMTFARFWMDANFPQPLFPHRLAILGPKGAWSMGHGAWGRGHRAWSMERKDDRAAKSPSVPL